jgi:hypothetical protein
VFLQNPLQSKNQIPIELFSPSTLDSLDSMPVWNYEVLKQFIANTLAHYPKLFDPLLPPKENSNGMTLVDGNIIDSAVFKYPMEFHILAWVREWLPCGDNALDSNVSIFPEDEIGYRVLVWVNLTRPETQEKRWAIMTLRPPSNSRSWILASIGMQLNSSNSAVRVFKMPPQNIDIYNYLESVDINGRPAFDFEYNIKNCQNIYCDCGRFMDGNVFENTWRLVTGEDPSRYFTNGN